MEVTIVKDSISEHGVRLTTFSLKYQRFIHSELMTHRMFSRNASSSRAIPLAKFINQVNENPAMPIFWGKNESGMQAHKEIDDDSILIAKNLWIEASKSAIKYAEQLGALGVHKQIVNRLLEPYQFIHVVLTATDFNNFFNLRTHIAAQPEIRALAIEMLSKYNSSKPELIGPGEWHLPFILEEEKDLYKDIKRVVSVARCARVSYKNHDNTVPNIEKDKELYNKLHSSNHLSPFEHVATPDDPNVYYGNFRGWKQLRKFFQHESGNHILRRDIQDPVKLDETPNSS